MRAMNTFEVEPLFFRSKQHEHLLQGHRPHRPEGAMMYDNIRADVNLSTIRSYQVPEPDDVTY